MPLLSEFEAIIALLKQLESSYALLATYLYNYKKMEVIFTFSERPSHETRKQHLLDLYANSPHVTGYESLAPQLRQTERKHVCVSNIITDIGTFIVFTNFKRTELIGVLISSTTRMDMRRKLVPLGRDA